MDGGDRAGYKQIAGAVDSILITEANSPCTGDWIDFKVVSSGVQFVAITAPGMANASVIDSDATFVLGAKFACSKITIINITTGSSFGKVVAHNRILI